MATNPYNRPSDFVLIAKAREYVVRRTKSPDLPIPAEFEECFNGVYSQYDPLVRRFASHSGVPKHELDEASQDAWSTIIKQIESLDCGAQHGSFRGWLCMQVRRAVIDQFRKRQRVREQTADIDFHQIGGEQIELGDRLEARWRAEVLRLALAEFQNYESADDYKLFYDRKFGGMSIEELAEDSGLSSDIIRQRIFRVFRRFCEFLKSRGHYSQLDPG